MSTAPATTDIGTIAADPGKIASVMKRLDDQIQYHETKSAKSQRRYKRIKGTEMVAAALIPFLAALHVADIHAYVKTTLAIATALLGVLITVLEGILQLNQYQQLWVTSRSAAKHSIMRNTRILLRPAIMRNRMNLSFGRASRSYRVRGECQVGFSAPAAKRSQEWHVTY